MKNVTIRWRIAGSFGVILALMTGMGWLDFTRLLSIETETTNAETSALTGLFQASALRDAWSDNLTLTEQQVFEPDDALRRRVDAALLRNRDALSKTMADIQPAVSTPEAAQAFDRFKTAQLAYARIQDDVLGSAANPARRQEAMRMVGAQLLPEFETGQTAIESLVNFNKKYSEESITKIATDVSNAVSRAKTAVISDLLAALALGLVSGVGLMLSITRPLSSLNGLVDVIGTGDFTQRAALGRRDEFGALGDGFNKMSDELTTLVGQVKESGLKVSTSVMEIGATAREQQATANEVAATTAEIGATSREISATSKELLRTMNDVSEAAEQSAAIAGTGQTGLTQMEETMRHVIDAAGSVTDKLATLNEKAADISQVVTTITKVADQTNLLSLNAAIEAEKAGEYGRGFAVVATEIRRLADQTAVATHDIDRMVKAIQSAVSGGVMSMDKFSEQVRRGMQVVQDVGGQLTQVIHQTQALAPRFEAVTEGMQAQATGAEQITEALSQLSEAARQTVESLRQSNTAIEDLNHVALALQGGVSRFTLRT